METSVNNSNKTNPYIEQCIEWQQTNYNQFGRILAIIIIPILFFGFILLMITPGFLIKRNFGITLGFSDPYNLIFADAFLLIGMTLYLWTIILFAKAWGTQVPVIPTLKLVTNGPYALTRNPMVTSAIIIIAGLAIAANSLAVFLSGMVVPILYLIYIKLVEEKELEARFREEYLNYKKITPFIIPRIKCYFFKNQTVALLVTLICSITMRTQNLQLPKQMLVEADDYCRSIVAEAKTHEYAKIILLGTTEFDEPKDLIIGKWIIKKITSKDSITNPIEIAVKEALIGTTFEYAKNNIMKIELSEKESKDGALTSSPDKYSLIKEGEKTFLIHKEKGKDEKYEIITLNSKILSLKGINSIYELERIK